MRIEPAGDLSAWKLALLPDATKETRRLFLEPHHRAALIKATPPAGGTLMRALELTGARPKEPSEAAVADRPYAGSFREGSEDLDEDAEGFHPN